LKRELDNDIWLKREFNNDIWLKRESRIFSVDVFS
jgi:hypothetical protein